MERLRRVHKNTSFLEKARAIALLTFAVHLEGAPALRAVGSPPRAEDYNVSAAADPPRWQLLDAWQFAVTREEFCAALTGIYGDGSAHKTTIRIFDDHADIVRSTKNPDWPPYRLNFARSAAERRSPTRPARPYWRPAAALPPARFEDKPLAGVKIAIDPGHIGGAWAKIEARWFRIGSQPPVKEGELTLAVARVLRPKLEALGAKVALVRENLEPVTEARPADFTTLAKEILRNAGVAEPELSYENLPPHSPRKAFTVQWQSELLFYRATEIRDRGERVNTAIRPDLVLCVHFNAEDWGDPEKPTFVPKNHLHVLCNGAYSLGEFASDDIRLEMLLRLVQGIHEEEIPLCDAVAAAMAEATGLPPYVYPGNNAKRVNGNAHLYARNLLANRIYRCPVVYLEPYVMNHREVFARIQAADRRSPNIFDEYAEGVVAGLVAHYEAARGSDAGAASGEGAE